MFKRLALMVTAVALAVVGLASPAQAAGSIGGFRHCHTIVVHGRGTPPNSFDFWFGGMMHFRLVGCSHGAGHQHGHGGHGHHGKG